MRLLFTEKKIKGRNNFEAGLRETLIVNQIYDVVYNKKKLAAKFLSM